MNLENRSLNQCYRCKKWKWEDINIFGMLICSKCIENIKRGLNE